MCDTTQRDINRKNPFFEPYNTPHDTVPFDRIALDDYEEAFMEGIRRDDEEIEKTVIIKMAHLAKELTRRVSTFPKSFTQWKARG